MASQYFDMAAAEADSDEELNEQQENEDGEQATNGAKRSKSKDRIDDSSEEDDDEDEDEEELARVGQGFIADEDEVDQDESEARRQRRRERKKRRREEREQEDEALDDEDLDLIGVRPTEDDAQQSKFKRLKRGHRDDRSRSETRGVEEIFEDEDDLEERPGRDRGTIDEFDDFIEQDEFPDEERDDADVEIRRPAKHGFRDPHKLTAGMDEAAREDMLEAFGDGQEYDWALAKQDDEDEAERANAENHFELKDVFEPSQLIDKMLTDEDERIRETDIPERFQLAWKDFKTPEMTDEEREARLEAETEWMYARMAETVANLKADLRQPFKNAVKQVLTYINVDNFEPSFILANRKDYLIHEAPNDDPDAGEGQRYTGVRLLEEAELWTIQELDLEYKAFVEKRDATQETYDSLQNHSVHDPVITELIAAATTAEELQDIHDYIHFQYSSELKDAAAVEPTTNGAAATQKRARTTRYQWEKVRSSQAYRLVSAFGISADTLAKSALRSGAPQAPEDPDLPPEDMADQLICEGFATGSQVMSAARAMFVEELFTSPRMRKLVRQTFYQAGVFDCVRTQKGLRRIDEGHPDYKIKYLREQEFSRFVVEEPELFLQMMKAEQDGLVEVRLRLIQPNALRDLLYKYIISENVSDIAETWNMLRRDIVDVALPMLTKLVVKGCKESLRTRCETKVLESCRRAYKEKLDQAPYKPAGSLLGVIPRVLAMSNGAGGRNDAICWAYVDENGAVVKSGKYTELRLGDEERQLEDSPDVAAFHDLLQERKADVIAVSGWSVATRKLYLELTKIVEKFGITSDTYEDEDSGDIKSDPVEVFMVNDEVARMYHTSPRAAQDHPSLPTLTRYCVALAKYMQGPLKQYAALGGDIMSIPFNPHQHLVSQSKLRKYLEMAMIETVNLTGVDINLAMSDPYTANLLQYVCGLGPRKANALVKHINRQGGAITSRPELTVLGPVVFTNAASFLYLNAESDFKVTNLFDSTRIHPEDYDLARKMIMDAFDMDEEDRLAEEESDEHAIANRMKSEEIERVQDLILDDYADSILRNLGQRKRATLKAIAMELQTPFEELREKIFFMAPSEQFTMLTGETSLTLASGMIIPVSIKKSSLDRIDVKLDCGIDGIIQSTDFPEKLLSSGLEPKQVFSLHQSVQAKVLQVEYDQFVAHLSMRESDLREPTTRDDFRQPGQWDTQQEAQDRREALKETETKSGRAQRVIKHPLYRIMNSAQAEEFLGSQGRGDVVIRPSSKGPDHLAVTWKVSDNVYQHVDVLELEKENDFSVGKTLKVGRDKYSDLDELIELHIKAMAKKVDEMMADEKFQNGSKAQTGKLPSTLFYRDTNRHADKWLETYMEANPKRSMYAFCINPKFPGYFHLCFKADLRSPLSSWNVKVIPNAFELQKNPYSDMRALKNGFKLLFSRGGAAGMNGRR